MPFLTSLKGKASPRFSFLDSYGAICVTAGCRGIVDVLFDTQIEADQANACYDLATTLWIQILAEESE